MCDKEAILPPNHLIVCAQSVLQMFMMGPLSRVCDRRMMLPPKHLTVCPQNPKPPPKSKTTLQMFMMGTTGDLIALSKPVSDPVFMWTTGWGFFFGGFLFSRERVLSVPACAAPHVSLCCRCLHAQRCT